MELRAYAKINWTLDIVGQREDGYHLMDMLMQPVSLYDTVWLEQADELHLVCEGEPLLPADEHHLALCAAVALQKATGCTQGAHIRVQKRIPVGAGMGGGSADAAAVLVGLNRLWSLSLSREELMRIGLNLGADVPFCIHGGLARVGGIGEIIRPIEESPKVWLCVIQPCEALSTKVVFQGYHAMPALQHPQTEAALHALLRDRHGFSRFAVNVLQSVSIPARPAIEEAIHSLFDQGAYFAQMTGSGSAVFGMFDDEETAVLAAQRLKRKYPTCFSAYSQQAGVEMISN